MQAIASVFFAFFSVVCCASDFTFFDISAIETDVDGFNSNVQRAASWIRQLRNVNYSWGTGDELALLALSQDPSWNASEPESLVSLQHVDIRFLWQRLNDPEQKHFSWEQRIHLAQMLIAYCRNPSDYYGFDLLDGLLDVQPYADSFEYASKLLTVCSGNGNINKTHVRRLMRVVDKNYWINRQEIDSLSLVLIAAGCVAHRYGYSSLLHYASDLPHMLMKTQLTDGSFRGNVISTGLAIQALQVEGLNMDTNQTIESAKKWLMSAQKSDGSFGDLLSTTESMLALSSMGGRSNLHLGRCLLDQFTDNGTDSSDGDREMIHFHLVLWIGQPVREQHVLQLSAPGDTTVFQALTMAAERDENFQFEHREYHFGQFITSIRNVTEDRANSLGWLVYTLPLFDVQRGHGDTARVSRFQISKSVSQLPVKDGEYILFWYKLIDQH